MFHDRPRPEVFVDSAISQAVLEMRNVEADSHEFSAAAKNLEVLCKARAALPSNQVTPDALVALAGNLAGILLILHHERLNVIATKALTFVWKAKP